MMNPMLAEPFTILGLTGLALVAALVGVFVVLPMCVLLLFSIRKVEPGKAGVRVGWRGYIISDTWIFRVPLVTRYDLMDISVQKLEIERKGQDGLICEDNIRADIVVAFYIKVNYPKVNYPEGIEAESAEGRALWEKAMNSRGQEKYEDIQKVAQTVGCERATDIDKLRELFEAKFSEALKTAGKEMEFTKLYTDRLDFRDKIIDVIGKDLNGYALEDVAIDYLEQTPLDKLDEHNVLDAEGIKKITMITSEQQELTNDRDRAREIKINEQNQQASVQVEIENVDAEVGKRAQGVRDEEDKAKQSRAVAEVRANEDAEARKVVEAGRLKQETEAIGAQEGIEVRAEDKDRAVMSARYSKEQDLLRLEQEKIEAGQQAEVDRERRIGLASQEKEAVVIHKAEEVAESKAGLEAKEKEVTVQTQNRLDAEADMAADRAYRVSMVKAKTDAETAQVEQVVAAEAKRKAEQEVAELEKYQRVVGADAEKEAADREAEKVQVLAAAEANASEKRNHAMQQEAEGQAALKSADGLAEARVTEAKGNAKKVDAEGDKAMGLAQAEVTEAQGSASGKAMSAEGTGEATAISAKGKAQGESIDAIKSAEASGREAMGLADAKSKLEMAKSIEVFNKASQDHEEFRLQLNKDRDVDLAEIQIQKDIAEAQARVVGEALKSANIDIVGGEHDFFEKVVKSVIQGRSLDRLVNNSQTLTDVKDTFFNGDPDRFKGQLRTWIRDLGLSSEDVKNLTVSALLTKLISKADDSGTKSLIRQAQKMAKEAGIMDIVSNVLLTDESRK
jgi:uncharacterized membrane protein YqiK